LFFSATYGTTCDELYINENIVKEEIAALNNEITSDGISNEIDSHVRSADVEVASVNKFIDELHVRII
jgi:hypothetical protein